MDGLLSELRFASIHPRHWKNHTQKMSAAQEVQLLVIDDYKSVNTEWERLELFRIFNHRYNAMLPMVVTSSDVHLSTIDPLIASRMSDGELVTMVKMEEASDYREGINQ